MYQTLRSEEIDFFSLRNYIRRGSTTSGEGRRLIFVGTMPDIITINYVKHDDVTGLMKLKKVIRLILSHFYQM